MGKLCVLLGYSKNHQNLTIVHLEMVTIILALKVFGPMWKGKKITIKCDNEAVVKVLSHGRTLSWLLVPGMRGTLQLMLTPHMFMSWPGIIRSLTCYLGGVILDWITVSCMNMSNPLCGLMWNYRC